MPSFFRSDFHDDLGPSLRGVADAIDEFFAAEAKAHHDLSTEVTGEDHQHHVYIRVGSSRPAKFCTFPRRTDRENNFDMQIGDLAAALGDQGFDEERYRLALTTSLKFLIRGEASTKWRFIKVQYEGLRSPQKRERFFDRLRDFLAELRHLVSSESSATTIVGAVPPIATGARAAEVATTPRTFQQLAKPAVPDAVSTADSDIFDAENELALLSSTERSAVIAARRGQGRYRRGLLRLWINCSVTGCGAEKLLRASHLKPWRDSSNSERLDPYNGLLLTPNLDLALDRCLITFANDGHIMISEGLAREDAEALGISPDLTLRSVKEEHLQYLAFHRDLFEAHQATLKEKVAGALESPDEEVE